MYILKKKSYSIIWHKISTYIHVIIQCYSQSIAKFTSVTLGASFCGRRY